MSLSRREFARRLLAGMAASSAPIGAACGSSVGAAESGGGGRGGAGGSSSCILYPRQTEGPFYLDLDSVRSDLTEGRAGMALRLRVEVQTEDCSPLRDLAVDVWHCDAAGVYSGFPGQLGGRDTTAETFLRGTQLTDANGIAEFETIYPGWYPGRTTHIHFKVHTSSTTEATSQIYFPEDVTSEVYGTGPYESRGQKDTTNSSDLIARSNPAPLAKLDGSLSSGYQATIVVTVV